MSPKANDRAWILGALVSFFIGLGMIYGTLLRIADAVEALRR